FASRKFAAGATQMFDWLIPCNASNELSFASEVPYPQSFKSVSAGRASPSANDTYHSCVCSEFLSNATQTIPLPSPSQLIASTRRHVGGVMSFVEASGRFTTKSCSRSTLGDAITAMLKPSGDHAALCQLELTSRGNAAISCSLLPLASAATIIDCFRFSS